MATNVRVDFSVLTVSSRIKSRIKRVVQPQLDNQILKDSNFYAPMDIGGLIDSGIRGTRLGSGKVTWDIVYARRQYYEDNVKSKDNNPNATRLWFEVAKSNKKRNWVDLANRIGGFED